MIPSLVLPDEPIDRLPSKFLKILKPLNGYRGSGITLVENKDQITEWLNTHSKFNEWILQDYIKNPALKDGKKFHLRILVVVKKEYRKPIEAFVANHKFYVKAEELYKKEDWLNPKIHDTHFKPGKLETFPDTFPDDWTEKDTHKADIKLYKIIQDLLSEEDEFKADWNSKNGFEMFGIDLLFDKKKPYILELNNKMSLSGRSSYAAPLVDLILENKIEPYFTRIL